MGQHDLVLGRGEPQGPQQSALDVPRSTVEVGGRLLVDVQRRHLVRDQDAGLPPRGQQCCRAGVSALTCTDVLAWEDEAYDVVLAVLLERDHPVGVDDVVRRGGQRGQWSRGRRVVAKGTER